jgi:hypothetical protein
VDGDSWLGTDVPLGEESEAYLVRVLCAGTLVREVEVDRARWSYAPGDQVSDGGAVPLVFQVAQLSGRFGPGPFEEITFHV